MIFNEQRCGASSIVYDAGNHIFGWNGRPFQLVELKIIEENRFQPTLKGTAKRLACVVGKLDRMSYTLCAFFLSCKPFGDARNTPPD